MTKKKHQKSPKVKIDHLLWLKNLVHELKAIFKELKRTQWPKSALAWKTFLTTLIFITISSLLLFGMTITFANLWTELGIGLI